MIQDSFANNEGAYAVNSLYYDSPQFRCFHEKMDGLKNRKKLRLRYYGMEGDKATHYLEIKRKSGDTVIKDRAHLKHRESHAESKTLEEFKYMQHRFNMSPKLWVRYLRAPLVGKFDSTFRITFDQDIQAKLAISFEDTSKFEPILPNDCILEVKFNHTLPRWFYGLIQQFKLERQSFSKYCESLIVCKPHSRSIFPL